MQPIRFYLYSRSAHAVYRSSSDDRTRNTLIFNRTVCILLLSGECVAWCNRFIWQIAVCSASMSSHNMCQSHRSDRFVLSMSRRRWQTTELLDDSGNSCDCYHFHRLNWGPSIFHKIQWHNFIRWYNHYQYKHPFSASVDINFIVFPIRLTNITMVDHL